MGLSFANPAAVWGLLGLPAVLLIHFLQTRNRPREISTLFLLDMLPEESRKGAVMTRIRNSLQLWCQLLAVLFATLLLAQPMLTRPESVQSVALVLDSTVATRAFRDHLRRRTEPELRRLSRAAARTEWLVLPSEPAAPPLYRGDELSGVLTALSEHDPLSGTHDPRPALSRARDLAGPEGIVLWITPFPPDAPPAGAIPLGIGVPTDNGGFTGVRVERGEDGSPRWVATLALHGAEDAPRRLQVTADGRTIGSPADVLLPADSLLTLRGGLPPDTTRGVLRLNPDDFGFDDALPFVVPEPKILLATPPADDAWGQRVFAAIPHLRPPASGEVVNFTWESFQAPAPPGDRSGVFVFAGEAEAPHDDIVVEDHPLTEGLAWGAFVGRPMAGFDPQPRDQVLVWMGETPLVVLRESAGVRQLLYCFHPRRANADRLPAAVLTAGRFAERVREALPVFEAANVHTRQRLRVAADPGGGDLVTRIEPVEGDPYSLTQRPGFPLHAPPVPSFFEIHQGERLLFRGAAHFADAPAADLTRAESRPLPGDLLTATRERHSRREWLTPLWFALLTLCLLTAWWSENRRKASRS